MAANKCLNWSYQDADQFLRGGKDHDYRPTGERNTAVVRYSDGIVLKYHDTKVVWWYPNGRIVINAGGYTTATTKKRINDYGPVTVYQRDYLWYVNGKQWTGRPMEVTAAVATA